MTGYVDWKQWDAASFGRCCASQERYFAWHLARCGGAQARTALEIGFGNGASLGYAKARHIAIQGIDLEPELCARAKAVGVPAATSLDAQGGTEAFDLIVAFDVFEHLSPDALGGCWRNCASAWAACCCAACRTVIALWPQTPARRQDTCRHLWAGQAGASR